VKFAIGQAVWARGYVSGVWYPAIVSGLPRLTRLRCCGRPIKPPVLAYQIETCGRVLACEEEHLRPRDDLPPRAVVTVCEMKT
jgi:hypothetical protein